MKDEITCSCGLSSTYFKIWQYPNKQNNNWSWEGGQTSIIHCPVCGEMIILNYYIYRKPNTGDILEYLRGE